MQENQGKWMQVRRAVLMALTGAALALGEGAMAQATSKPPERMTYQGFIAGSDGVALGNSAPKNYDVIFRIYDSEGSNTPLWGEQQTVTVDKGYFSVLLGEGAAVTGVPNSGITLSSLFSGATASDRYVGFTVKGIGTGGADVDILPRVRLMTSPYAFLASRALAANTAVKLVQDNAGGADLLSGSGSQLTLNGNLGVAGANTLEFGYGVTPKGTQNGKIGYGTFSGDSLDIVGAGATQANRKVRFYSEGGVTFDGPITAPSLSLSGAFSVGGGISAGSLNVTSTIDVQGFNAIRFGGGRTKDYAWTGSVGYMDYTGKDTLAIQGGGATIATRTVDMWAEAGFRLHGMQMIEGSQTIELGYGVTGKEGSAGRIGYGTFSGAGLDIVGAGQTVNQRWIVMHGAITVNGLGQFGRTPLYVGGYKFDAFNRAISLQAEQSISAVSFVQSSDRRIKDIVGVSSSQKDIENLRKIRVTDYRLKTVPNVNQPVVKGVVAQEVETVLPSAIGKGSNIIPCDRIAATAIGWKSADKPFSLKMESDHGLAVGQEIRVEADGVPATMAVRSVIDGRTIEVGGMSFTSEPKSVALIGREVKDFLSVDYQQIYMTAVSALQEVDRRVQALEKREAAAMELEKKAARVDALERDVAELRKLVAALATTAGKDKASASLAPGPDSVSVAKAR